MNITPPYLFSAARIFGVALISAFLLTGGLLTITFTYWPVLAAPFYDRTVYQPQLPLAEDRLDAPYDVATERELAKRPFPSRDIVPAAESGNWIRIPSIGVAVPLVQSATMNDSDVLATLDLGAALYPNGINPGNLGTTFISAHSTGEPWKGKYRFAFLHINELYPGNLIHLDWHGTRYTYRVTEQRVVTPDPDFKIVSDRPVPTLELMACWPLWSTSKRMLIHGELAHITKLTPAPAS
jgi:LPXTG-site transpeptidase (sortase) family protein